MTLPVAYPSTSIHFVMGPREVSHFIRTPHSFGASFFILPNSVLVDIHYSSSSYAIKGSPNQKLLLEDIYYAIESRVGITFH
jgi:hypothetical protein